MVGMLCGARLLFVQVDEDARGRCDFERSTLTGDGVVRTAMAGPAAEYMYHHPGAVGFTFADCNASIVDLEDVEAYCAKFLPAEGQSIREQHWAVTCQILASNWAAIQRVASEIKQHAGTCLCGTAIAELAESRR